MGKFAAQFKSINLGSLRKPRRTKWGNNDDETLCSWVADMDFGIAPAIKSAIEEMIRDEEFGYPFWDLDPVIVAFESRMKRLYDWAPIPERTKVLSDLIQVLQIVLHHSTKPGDGIAIHVPAYNNFLVNIEEMNRRIGPLQMEFTEEGWKCDNTNLAARLKAEGVKMIIVINPQNPTGRAFTHVELTELADAAKELDIPVLSDEIHSDLLFDDHVHIPFALLSTDAAARTITTTSATKGFNIAGTRTAIMHVGPDALWNEILSLPIDYFGAPNTIGKIATAVAWTDCDDWLDDLNEQLATNRAIINEWVDTFDGKVKYHAPEATYLAWLDLSLTKAGAAPEATEYILEHAKVRLATGSDYSQHTVIDTHSWVRLNFATNEETLREILRRVGSVL